MALDRLTKIDGGGISTTSDYRVGIITATKFVGPIEGTITSTDANFTGNVTIGGTLTYEDVTNIDSVGIITARDGIDCNGDLDVDGHTNLDNVSIAGVTTTTDHIYIDADNKKLIIGDGSDLNLYHTGSRSEIINNTGDLIIQPGINSNLLLRSQTGAPHFKGVHAAQVELNWNGNKRLETSSVGVSITKDLDVDGHTNLDNVSIAGVSTVYGHGAFGSTVDITGDLTISDTIKHIGDSNTKIRFPANDTISFETAGSERVRITSGGNVDIITGDLTFFNNNHKILTNSSGHMLTIQGGASKPGGRIEFRGGNSSGDIRMFAQGNTSTAAERLRIASDGLTTVTGELNVINSANTTLKLLDSSGTPDSYGFFVYNNGSDADDTLIIGVDGGNQQGTSHIRFYVDGTTSSAEKLRIDSSGRVLIGGSSNSASSHADELQIINTSAQGGLSIINASNGQGNIYFGHSGGTADGRIEYSHQADYMRFFTANNERVRITSGGLVGIGTDNPADILHLQSTAPIIKVDATNNASGLRIDVLGQTGGGNNQLFRVQRDATTKFQINDDGDVVITGDDNAELKLKAGTTTGNGVIAFLNSSGTTKGNIFYDTDDNFMVFKTNGTAASNERLRILSDGKIGIGTNNPLNPLEVWGSSVDLAIMDTQAYSQNSSGPAVVFQGYDSAGVRKTFADIRGVANGSNIGEFAIRTRRTGGTLTEALRITSDGKIGINASNPNSLLEVRATGGTYTNAFTVFTGNTTHSGSNSKNGIGLYSYGDALRGGLSSNLLYSNSSTPSQSYASRSSGQIEITNTTSSNATSEITFGGYYKGTTSFVERLRIASDGKVKIGGGTASLALLHIAPTDYSLNLQNNSSNKSMILFSKNGTPNDARSWIEGNGELNGYLAFAAGDSEKLRIESEGQLRMNYGNNAKQAYALRSTFRTITGHSTTGYQYVRFALLGARTPYRVYIGTTGGNYGPGAQFFTVLRNWDNTTFYVTDKFNMGTAYANAVRMQSDTQGGDYYLELNINLTTTSQGFNASIIPIGANAGTMITALQFYGSDMSDLTYTSSAQSL